MVKTDSLFREGLQPLLLSKVELSKSGKGWHRTGDRISYSPNEHKFSKAGQLLPFQSLSVDIVFPHDNDACFLASCYPYTYTDLQKHLLELTSDASREGVLVRKTLAVSAAGNACDVVMVSSPLDALRLPLLRAKPAIVVSARVHPGESNASYVMHGVLEYMTGSAHCAQVLRDSHVMYLIPMLNPDGVINGNTRCNLSGQDLNRQWLDPNWSQHPTVRSLKGLLEDLAGEGRLVLYIDLHGHSNKKGFFLYCCDSSVSTLPLILAKRSPFFALGSCTYKVAKQKQCTGRAVVYNHIGCGKSFTLEASMMGADLGDGDGSSIHFNPGHLRQMGAHLCEAITEYILPEKIQQRP
eukprot:CAMPEP_0181317492 /NCGR_PEP_ID=MMETSP1101-20121128/16498_1 /TAXON_ID=46948 /ORGANISM="Rhodomonas abbreviata, Strain Caron Lab Isolate" /LENGTH=352 /DNA_ID=CAMNT_0023424891 /DNA_START=62 /DNA_END=1120 /DNA_ORIENTATION=+